MNPNNLTEEQKKDIEERVEKAKTVLEELHLRPAAQVYKVNTGEDVFADKVVPYLVDTRFAAQASPIQP